MADKYLYNNAGVITEKEATVTSAGAGDAGELVALDAAGKLDNSVMPTGIGADTVTITTSEDLAAGDFVNIYDNASTPTARKADASNDFEAHGFVLAASTSGNNATVYFEGSNNQVTGQTAGNVYLSAATAGDVTATAPSGSGNLVQKVGVATSATNINVELSNPIKLA